MAQHQWTRLGESDGVEIRDLERASPPAAGRFERAYENILFLHFRMPREIVRAWIPRRLDLELYDGAAWVAIVAATTRSRRPEIPTVHHELSIRTYVEGGGIYLLGLDLDDAMSLWTAQRCLRLRSYRARMVELREGRAFGFSAHRLTDVSPPELITTWSLGQPLTSPELGSLERFFLDRNRVCAPDHDIPFAARGGVLSSARLGTFHSTFLQSLGLPTPREAPEVHFAREQLVELTPP